MRRKMNKELSVCVCAITIKSYGICRTIQQNIIGAHKLKLPVRFTIYIHPLIRSKFAEAQQYCDIIEVPIHNLFMRLIYLHLIFPFVILKKKYHLVHSPGNTGMLRSLIPQIITIHDTYEKVSPERFGILKRVMYSISISISGRNAAKIIAVSQNTARDIAMFYPYLSQKVVVIYSGNTFSNTASIAIEKKKNFLFVGTIEPGKNLVTVLKAFSRYRREGGNRYLCIVGAMGWQQSHLPEIINKLGLEETVCFEGEIDDKFLEKKYLESFALLFPSKYEGFGLPVIEAMACGCPVIAAKNSAIVEAGGKAALYFETMNSDDLCEKIQFLENNPNIAREMIKAGRNHAGNFYWEKCAGETYNVYLKAIKR